MINIEELGMAIAHELAGYSEDVTEATKAIVNEVSDESVETLKKTSPHLTGDYRRGWRKRKAYEDSRESRMTVHNKTDYQITHLLEYGHASRYGGRVSAKVHIKPVEETVKEELQKRIEKAVQQ